ncbi:MAG: TRAP transporter small permease subunit [Deltaproteobacteria bacterium]|nr:TRAP transporter small permease subunit [Deltaproteobacteria bacterium]
MSSSLCRGINLINEKIGRLGALLILPMVAVVVYEVIMRYLFKAATSWGFEATTFIYGVHYILGLSYTQLHNGHVSIDIFEARLATRKRAILAVITNLIIFFPTFACMTIFSWKYALDSCRNLEHQSTSWGPPTYPFKILMATGFTLLFLQMVAKLIEDWKMISENHETEVSGPGISGEALP